ncbi:MAG: DUF342 domain-containing protein [Deltaproteobacteria bacterium]|nr:DUF342 domain-containing protein [Deltaproteobacteria bacterium]
MGLTQIIVEAADQKKALEQAAKQLFVSEKLLKAKLIAPEKFLVEIQSIPGKLHFKVSDDKMKVTLEEMQPPQGILPPPHSEWIRGLQELSQMKVKFGIDENTLKQAIDRCIKSKTTVKNILIATGVESKKGPGAKLKTFFNETNRTAMPGDIILIKTKPQLGITGLNIFNESVEGKLGEDISVQCGPFVEARENQEVEVTEYIAKSYGEISFRNNKLEIISSLKVAADKMSATIDLHPRSCRGATLTPEIIIEILKAAKITSYLSRDEMQSAISQAIEKNSSQMNFLIAKAIAPQNGTNEEVIIWPLNRMASMVKEKISGLVKKGQILALRKQATKAVAGADIFGKSLKGQNGIPYRMSFSKAAEVIKDSSSSTADEMVKANISGRAVIGSHSLDILPIIKISSDEMSATIDFHPHLLDGSSTTSEFFHQILEEAKINFGIQQNVIDNLILRGKEAANVCIAKGEEPISGNDGYLEKFYSDRSRFVKSGEVIAIVHPPSKGSSGRDLFGKELKAEDGIAFSFSIGAGVESNKEENGKVTIRATTFGEVSEDRGKISVDWEVEIFSDRMKATGNISAKTIQSNSIELNDIVEALKQRKVTSGICKLAIENFLRLPESADSQNFTLALGREPTRGQNERLEYLFTFNHLSKSRIESADEAKLKERSALQIVRKGDALAKIIKAEPGEDGENIFGEKIPFEPGEKFPPLEIGDGVHFDQRSGIYTSTISPWGYVDFKDRNLSVFFPIQIAEDRLSAIISLYPPSKRLDGTPSEYIGLEHLLEWSEQQKIKSLFDLNKFTELLDKVFQTQEPILNEIILRGIYPVDGFDDEIKIIMSGSKAAGHLRADGSMDLRERGAIINVRANEPIISVKNAGKGTDGCDIFGNTVIAKAGRNSNFRIGENIEKVVTPQGYKLISKIDGALIATKDSCSVIKTYIVDGDVHFETGNIKNPNGGVIIRGSVHADFSIHASDDIVVEGIVENAEIKSPKRIIVLGTVLGNRTQMVARGDIEVGLANKAQIIAYGKVNIRSESYQALIKSDDSVIIESNSGRATGGRIEAFHKIVVPQSGNSEIAVETHLAVGKNFATEKEVEDQIAAENLEKNIKKEEAEEKIISDEIFRLKNSKFGKKPENKIHLETLDSKANAIKESKLKLIKRKKELRSKIKTDPNAMIEVHGEVGAGTMIHILDKTCFVSTTLKNVRFRLDENGNSILIENLKN